MILSFAHHLKVSMEEWSIRKTADGSETLLGTRFGQYYHSVHGAIQESEHVFMGEGLFALNQEKDLRILEIGLGSGLNALLANRHRKNSRFKTHYYSYELFPISRETSYKLTYGKALNDSGSDEIFTLIHTSDWESDILLNQGFLLHKRNADVLNGIKEREIDLVFFDAFSPNSQPELWTVEVFKDIRDAMKDGAVLTTYCAKGDVRRAMIEAGLRVEQRPGPPGKREMLRAFK